MKGNDSTVQCNIKDTQT